MFSLMHDILFLNLVYACSTVQWVYSVIIMLLALTSFPVASLIGFKVCWSPVVQLPACLSLHLK